MYILGFIGSPGTECHDGSAALFKDGRIIVAVEQERFSRRKHAFGEAPTDAALFCLQYAGIKIDEVNYITYGWLETQIDSPKSKKLSDWVIKSYELTEKLLPEEKFRYRVQPPIYFVKHHIAHIDVAYFDSGFDDAACLVIDGRGEKESCTLAEIVDREIRIIRQYGLCHSLGFLYETASKYSGLGYDVPGKFMGLAPYGKPYELGTVFFDPRTGDFNVPIIDTKENQVSGSTKTTASNLDICTKWLDYFSKNCYPWKEGCKETIIYYLDFVATIQNTLVSTILSMLKYLKTKTSSDNLIIAGGVGLNCSANQVIHKSRIFKNVFVHPASNDAGCSIGSIYELCRIIGIKITNRQICKFTPYMGPEYSDKEIDNCIKGYGVDSQWLDEHELIEKVSDDLVNNRIVGWFQGRAELGPRALGNRSMLGNPCERLNLYKINEIKGREMWRPLAPSILEEYFDEVFESECSKTLCKYMLTRANVKSNWLKKIQAVVHVDATTRPHMVGKESKRFYSLISAFHTKTGVPLIINTSLNLKGEPIVNLPQEAFEVFLKKDRIDVLVVGNRYISRNMIKMKGWTYGNK